MAANSTIEWTETTWNPVVGCQKVSPGCANCYAERMSNRLASMAIADKRAGRNSGRKANYLRVINKNGNWNGRAYPVEEAVDEPRTWKSPRFVFVNSMSDLFHKDIPEDFIRVVFETMNACLHHTFQILTKRPERAALIAPRLKWTQNIWMGTSVENEIVSHRIKDLKRIPSHVRFLSIEPMLGPIPKLPLSGIHWVIVGGESGPGARPMELSWVRAIRDSCFSRGVSFFFKQWGGTNKKRTGRVLDGRTWDQMPEVTIQTKGKRANGRLVFG